MRHLYRAFILPATLVSLVVVSSKSAIAAILFESTLRGDQEVEGSPPGPFTPAPTGSEGIGLATLELNGSPGSWVLEYEINYSDLGSVIAAPFAHIHNAPQGANGPVVHNLDGADLPPISGSTSGTIIGDWRFDDADAPLTNELAQQLLNSNLYFNIHTVSFPGGEIRGQIFPQDGETPIPEPSTVIASLLVGSAFGIWRRRVNN
ncbi:CHRD domain-containing protein [Gloeocapsa sp. PCC 73106]|uniref:CHRD domain-containing protein n=1 Tax=Gloeocapsa sp. PCC 73106 TaxID=102232 RepID=UPI0002ABA341|nr:CHRD domain-containing protein [Gloeocapsa sp. PCC 73106]ELR96959.1 PEP-CTERM putative exosortase interaction domain-containing protein [Gloeocapsa sp. PCC 73106]